MQRTVKEGRSREEIASLLGPFLPPSSLELLLSLEKELLSWEDLEDLLFAKLLAADARELLTHKEISEDLANRILHLRETYRGMPSFILELKTRQLTYARISRCLLHLLLGLTEPKGSCEYIRLLGFRRSAGPLLSLIKQRATLPIVTKPSASKEFREDTLSLYSANLYEYLRSKKGGGEYIQELKRSPIIIP